MSKDNGGPAFPAPCDGENWANWQGMSLRAYYAGQALAASDWPRSKDVELGLLAAVCFDIADAMIAEGRRRNADS
ncbi:MAG: hypothetical protein OXF51_01815 [Alphaproteobacteria bacterium]|nr:hypothetical protein [Alphaproteobacteria bacterium]